VANLSAVHSARPESPSLFSNGEFEIQFIPDGSAFKVVASGLAKALGFRSAADVVESLPDVDKGYELVRTPGGDQHVWVISEPGFYRAMGQRQAARVKDLEIRGQVERFQSWVFGDVLPSIRRTGSYSPTPALPQSYADALRELADAVEQRDNAVAELETAKPKAEAFDAYLAADDTDMLLRTAAKLLDTTEKKLRRHLLDAGFIFWTRSHTACGRAQYEPYAAHQQNGLFSLKKVTVTHETFGDCNHQTVYVTPKGLEAVRRHMAKTAVQPASELEATR
jgi:anti-repressor protein